MDITTLAQYANIASGIVAIVTVIPTFMSFYRGWGVTIRRFLSALFCVSLGIAIGTSLVPGVPSTKTVAESHSPAPTTTPASPVPSVPPSPSQAELENRRLQRELNDQKAKAAEIDKRAAQLEADRDAIRRELAALRDAQRQTPPPEVGTPKVNPAGKANDSPPPRQKLEHFVVEVPRAQILDAKATIYVRFTSTTNARIKMLLPAGFQGDGKIFLVDDIGQQYDLDKASGIGTCCFGFAGGDWQGGILELPPKGNAEITLTFRRRGRFGEREPERAAKTFALTAELILGDVAKIQEWPNPQWRIAGSASISIADITPQ
jgi:hypothetical protein